MFVKNYSDIFRDVKAQLKKECIERVTTEISKDMVENVVTELVDTVSNEVFETDVTQRLEQMEKAENAVKLSHAKKFWQMWRKAYIVNTKIKRAMEEFPSAPNMQSLTEQLQTLLNVDDDHFIDKRFYVNKRARLTAETPVEIEQRRKETDIYITAKKLYKDLRKHTAWQPIDIAGELKKYITSKLVASLKQMIYYFENNVYTDEKSMTTFCKLSICIILVSMICCRQ